MTMVPTKERHGLSGGEVMAGACGIYRDKWGWFVPKWKVLQGPRFPADPSHPINLERDLNRVERWRKAMAVEVSRASYFLKFMGL